MAWPATLVPTQKVLPHSLQWHTVLKIIRKQYKFHAIGSYQLSKRTRVLVSQSQTPILKRTHVHTCYVNHMSGHVQVPHPPVSKWSALCQCRYTLLKKICHQSKSVVKCASCWSVKVTCSSVWPCGIAHLLPESWNLASLIPRPLANSVPTLVIIELQVRMKFVR